MALSASSKPCAGYWSMVGEASCKDIELGPPLSALSCSCTGAGAGKGGKSFKYLCVLRISIKPFRASSQWVPGLSGLAVSLHLVPCKYAVVSLYL